MSTMIYLTDGETALSVRESYDQVRRQIKLAHKNNEFIVPVTRLTDDGARAVGIPLSQIRWFEER